MGSWLRAPGLRCQVVYRGVPDEWWATEPVVICRRGPGAFGGRLTVEREEVSLGPKSEGSEVSVPRPLCYDELVGAGGGDVCGGG